MDPVEQAERLAIRESGDCVVLTRSEAEAIASALTASAWARLGNGATVLDRAWRVLTIQLRALAGDLEAEG